METEKLNISIINKIACFLNFILDSINILWQQLIRRQVLPTFEAKAWSENSFSLHRVRSSHMLLSTVFSKRVERENSEKTVFENKFYLPYLLTLAKSISSGFPLYIHCNFTLGNSNLPLTRSNFCFPLDHFYIILPSITRTMFWALKKSGKTVHWRPKHWILKSHSRVVGI